MKHKQFTEVDKNKEISDDEVKPGCDSDGFPNAEIFNAMIDEGSASGNPDELEEDLFLDDDEDGCENMFDTLPEMHEIIHNIYIV